MRQAPRLPSLAALRSFEAAARHRSAKLAAAELSVTPTAISHQVRQLEETLGVPLFVRTPRQLVLTPQGRDLQAGLADAFERVAQAVAKARAPLPRRRVTLSTTPAVAARLLLPCVGSLAQAHPDLDLRIHASHEPVPLDGEAADVAIRYGTGRWAGMHTEKLFDNVFIPACSPVLGLRKRADIVGATLLHFEPRSGKSMPLGWPAWQAKARVRGLDAAAGPVFSDETLTITAALAGNGIALMSRALIGDELRRGALVQPFGPELRGEAFHFVVPTPRAREPLVAAVRDWVREQAAALAA